MTTTPQHSNDSAKNQDLDKYRVSGGEAAIANHGIKVSSTDNFLKVGSVAPSLPADFHFQQKLTDLHC